MRFSFAAHRQRGLQLHVERVGRQAVELGARLLQTRFVGADFLKNLRNTVSQFLDFVVTGRQRKAGFLMAPLGCTLQFARLKYCAVGLVALLTCLVQSLARRFGLCTQFDKMRFQSIDCIAFRVGLFGDFGQFSGDLCRPALHALDCLLQAHQFELRRVMTALGLPGLRAQGLDVALAFGVSGLRLRVRFLESRDFAAQSRRFGVEARQLASAGKDAFDRGVRPMKTDAVTRKDMALRRDQTFARP